MHQLSAIPPWDWPPTVAVQILEVLRDSNASPPDRLLAADFAGDLIVMNDDLAAELLRILENQDEDELLRGQAAVAFGAALEELEMGRIDDWDVPALTDPMMDRTRRALRDAYRDPANPKIVRRMALEASVRHSEPWHDGAIRAAYYDGDPDWRLTAVFCMRWTVGYADEIVEALGSDDPDVLLQAILAARDTGVPDAWPGILRIIERASPDGHLLPRIPDQERDLILAAMQAVTILRPEETASTLRAIIDGDDEELSEAAEEELRWAYGFMVFDLPPTGDTTWH